MLHFLTLMYLFFGIQRVADIFMEAIEKITAQKVEARITDSAGNEKVVKVPFWNGTIANLTLMALGSSAPEIILAVLDTVLRLGACPGELGASTIVGSAAFNLLVISAVSIYAVTGGPNDPEINPETGVHKDYKIVEQLGVFSITAFSSIFAYVWLWICLLDMQVSPAEAWLTFAFFPILVICAYAADYFNSSGGDAENAPLALEFSYLELQRELMKEKSAKSELDMSPDAVAKREKMKQFLRETYDGKDNIIDIDGDDLKKKMEGDHMLSRIAYRKAVANNGGAKKISIKKGDVFKLEHMNAQSLDQSTTNKQFGFKCLHYSVSESCGAFKLPIHNKAGTACAVHVRTVDDQAVAGEDYEAFDGVVTFDAGQQWREIAIKIKDDDDWEPDEDFFVELYDADTKEPLTGSDTRCRVTIIDDDKPGQICFEEKTTVKALASTATAAVVILRKNGSDGQVTVDYETQEIDSSDRTATAGRDYEHVSGTLTFQAGEIKKTIQIPIVPHEDPEAVRDETLGLRLTNVAPAGAKLTKKNMVFVNIITDVDRKRQEELYTQLLAKVEAEEEATWASQFITACMLHPAKNEDGEIEDVSGVDAFIHLLTIFWKVFFSFIPPAHYGGGWPCFVLGLVFIGITTFAVQAVAETFGCVIGMKPSVNAITFVALGTSLPDTFASMIAAKNEKYADAAIGNVTGSNSVNVFLGLGLPWVIATLYEGSVKDSDAPEHAGYTGQYFQFAGPLGFSVVVFVVCACVCVSFLVVRRITLGGELGGSVTGRTLSMGFLITLWFVYIILCTLQAYGIGGLDQATFGIQTDKDHWCNPASATPGAFGNRGALPTG